MKKILGLFTLPLAFSSCTQNSKIKIFKYETSMEHVADSSVCADYDFCIKDKYQTFITEDVEEGSYLFSDRTKYLELRAAYMALADDLKHFTDDHDSEEGTYYIELALWYLRFGGELVRMHSDSSVDSDKLLLIRVKWK